MVFLYFPCMFNGFPPFSLFESMVFPQFSLFFISHTFLIVPFFYLFSFIFFVSFLHVFSFIFRGFPSVFLHVPYLFLVFSFFVHWFSLVSLTFPLFFHPFSLFFHFIVFLYFHDCFLVFLWFSLIFLHWFSFIFLTVHLLSIGFPCFSIDFIINCPNQFRVFHWPWCSLLFIGFPLFPNFFVVFHWCSSSPISPSSFHQLFMLIIANIALLVLVAVAIAVVDLRHDGFKVESGRGVGGEGAAASPQGVGRI